MLKINPRAYLKSGTAKIFAEIADGVHWMNDIRAKMNDAGIGDHSFDFEDEIFEWTQALRKIDYSPEFYALGTKVVKDIVKALESDARFNDAYKKFSWDDVHTVKRIVHTAQAVIDQYFEQNSTFEYFRRNVFVQFLDDDISKSGAILGRHQLRGSACSVDEEEAQEYIFTSHCISINVHDTALLYQGGPNGVLSTLIHENMHSLEVMMREYGENYGQDDIDFEVLLASKIFYPDSATHIYADSLYREHVSERFCRSMQVVFGQCFDQSKAFEHMMSHPNNRRVVDKIKELTHHPS